MTVWDLIRAAVRRWPVLLAGAVASLGLVYTTTLDDGVYWSRTQVVFLAPASKAYPNALRTTSEDLIITAGVVAKAVSGPAAVTKYASPDATLVGEGIRDGWSVRLPDTGGQWAPNFAQQVLYVEVVGATAEQVGARQEEIIDQIEHELDRLQRDAGVAPVNDITVTVAPESTVVHQVGGSSMRAAGMAGLLGASATFTLIAVLETRARRRDAAGRAAEAAAEPAPAEPAEPVPAEQVPAEPEPAAAR
ncbi:hypothetical protein GCM10010413_03100 [Promicromonospora sukumoe]|uniref:Capsular polysaccharide biosynthesis protein n=1 Tax=Promicromonospora sukumoe TaxID=88382 RepID=A0A7W3JEU8_9MICO|nr:hypothetical protein [Promicromonospora sukumoe]MBA8811562.1 hypothetical protein [Promicromonospora sukumoe]